MVKDLHKSLNYEKKNSIQISLVIVNMNYPSFFPRYYYYLKNLIGFYWSNVRMICIRSIKILIRIMLENYQSVNYSNHRQTNFIYNFNIFSFFNLIHGRFDDYAVVSGGILYQYLRDWSIHVVNPENNDQNNECDSIFSYPLGYGVHNLKRFWSIYFKKIIPIFSITKI